MMMTIKTDNPFIKKANKHFKKDPALKKAYFEFSTKILKNPFDPSLKTHKLSGNLKDRYACSLTEKVRITFELSDDTICLLNIGSHDEVY